MVIADWIQANSVWIAFVITILVLVSYIVVAIKTFKKRRRIITPLTIILTVWGLLFFYYVAFVGSRIEPTGWGEIILLGGLVSITAAYAYSTGKMAEEMKEQRLGEARPYLLMRLEDLVKLEGDFDKLINAEKYELPGNFKIKIRNEGTGPAINIIAAFWRSDNVYPFQPKGYLAPQEEWQTTISTLRIDVEEIEMWLPKLGEIVKRDYPGTIAIEYRDIHGRTWVTYLQLQKYFIEENYIHIGEGEQNIVELKSND